MSLFEQQMEEGALYARLHQRQRKLTYALRGIEEMRKLAPIAYASISFGKQSICLAHMLYQAMPKLPMYFLASWESFKMHNYRDVIDRFCECWPINLHIVTADNVTNNTLDWKETRDIGFRDLQKMCDPADWDGWYWGLVKEESFGRYMTLSYRWKGQPHPTIFKYVDGKYRCCPLAEWDIQDIAAYVGEYDLPMLNTYKRNGLHARTTARITRDMAELAGVALMKHDNVSAFNEIVARFPNLRRFT